MISTLFKLIFISTSISPVFITAFLVNAINNYNNIKPDNFLNIILNFYSYFVNWAFSPFSSVNFKGPIITAHDF